MRNFVVCFVALVLLSGQAWGQAVSPDASSQGTVQKGLSISPVPLNLRNESLLARNYIGVGSYFVNGVGGCIGCHTAPTHAPGGDPFLGEEEQINLDGYLAGGAEFGPFISRNITPDAAGNPAGLTFAQFLSVLRTGVDLHDAELPTPFPSPLLQVMPWPEYKNLTDFDIRAIYEYLRRVPSKP
jgi:hypothetical protein